MGTARRGPPRATTPAAREESTLPPCSSSNRDPVQMRCGRHVRALPVPEATARIEAVSLAERRRECAGLGSVTASQSESRLRRTRKPRGLSCRRARSGPNDSAASQPSTEDKALWRRLTPLARVPGRSDRRLALGRAVETGPAKALGLLLAETAHDLLAAGAVLSPVSEGLAEQHAPCTERARDHGDRVRCAPDGTCAPEGTSCSRPPCRSRRRSGRPCGRSGYT